MGEWYIGQVEEHSESFMNLADVISNEVTAALWSIEEALENGKTEEEITEEWNRVFSCEESKFKDYDAIIDYLENVGV